MIARNCSAKAKASLPREPPYIETASVRSPGPQVIDGQQRLITLPILAAALRDAASDMLKREAIAAAVYTEPNP